MEDVWCTSTLSVLQPSPSPLFSWWETLLVPASLNRDAGVLGLSILRGWARVTEWTSCSLREKNRGTSLLCSVNGPSFQSCQAYLQPQLEGENACQNNLWLFTSLLFSNKYRTSLGSRCCSEKNVQELQKEKRSIWYLRLFPPVLQRRQHLEGTVLYSVDFFFLIAFSVFSSS